MRNLLAAMLYLVALTFVLTPPGLEGQRQRTRLPQTGQTVRWVTHDGERGQGRLDAPYLPGSKILILCPRYRMCSDGFDPTRPDTLDLLSVRRLELKVRDGVVRGAMTGGLIGVVLGVSLVAALSGIDDNAANGLPEYALVVGILTMPLVVVGALVGNSFDVWRPLSLEQDFRM